MSKIAVFGSGGVGGFFGALLSRPDQEGRKKHEVCFIARGEHLAEMRSKGLRVESVSGDFHLTSVYATDDPTQIGHVDLILICVKAWQLREALVPIASLVGPKTLLLPLENGVDSSEILAESFQPNQILRGLCAVVSFIKAPGVIKHIGPDPFMSIGEFDNRGSERIRQLQMTHSVPGLRVNIPNDILAAQWQKFLFISSLGVISSLSQLPAGVIKNIPSSRNLIEKAMKEVVQVAHAKGIKLAADSIEQAMNLLDQMPPDGTTSMQRDFMAGRRSELEAFSGYIVRTAAEVGASVPIHQTCYDLLQPLELKAQGRLREEE